MAHRIGISPSYLNLIEWNKRQISGALLRRIAEELDLELGDLDGVGERRLFDALEEIAHLPSLSGLGVEEDRIGELIGRFPGWARALAALARSDREASERIQVLTDRLSNDPFLSDTVHRMLTRIAAVRSASEILSEFPDAEPEQRDRFNGIVHQESRALSDVGEALASYLDKAEETDRALTPVDEVETMFSAHGNHFAEIEAAAAELAQRLSEPHPVARHMRAATIVEEELAAMLDRIVEAEPHIETEAARQRARRLLSGYAVGALLMPMALFRDQAVLWGYDIEALAQAFAVPVEAIAHRLPALSFDADLPVFGYFTANAAGSILEMRGLDGLALPRYAAACPLWVLYRSQQSPEAVLRQRALFPSGGRFVFVARARIAGPTGFGKPRHYLTDMIAMTEADAMQTIYAPDPSTPVEEVGPNCRMCPRMTCAHRVEDPLSS